MHYKIAQLILTPGQKASSTSEIFVAQSDAHKESLGGKLFLIVEIESRKNDSLKFINFLIDHLNNNYYYNEKMALRERIRTIKIEQIFESVIAKTNKDLGEFLRREKIKINPSLINATVGIIYENHIYFTSIGKNKALLIYPNKNLNSTTGEGKNNGKRERANSIKKSSSAPLDGRHLTEPSDGVKYKMSDIIEQSDSNEKKSPPGLNKLFSSVISGFIPRNGYLLFTNEAMPEYLSNKQLIEIITALPPASAAEQIKNELSKINAYVSFLGLIIKNTTGYEEPMVIARPSIKERAPSLNSVEKTTEKLLSASGIINFNNWLKTARNLPAKIGFSSKKSSIPAGSGTDKSAHHLLRDKIFLGKKASFSPIKKIGLGFKNISAFLTNILVYSFSLISNKQKLGELTSKIRKYYANRRETIAKISGWFMKLKGGYKISLVIAVIFIFLFLFNTTFLNIQNKKEEQQQHYSETIELIKQKQNQVEASLLYSNEESAKKLLEEVDGLLAQIPQKTGIQAKQYSESKKIHDEQMKKIRHIVAVDNPEKLADFINLNSQAKPTNLIMAAGGTNKIYIADSSQKSIYTLDLADNLITAITDLKLPIKRLEYPVSDKNGNIYYLNDNNIVQLDSQTENMGIFKINLAGGQENIADAAFYNNRLYLLDRENNQIYRHNKGKNTFSAPVSWIKGSEDFSKATSMVIDGHIYVLKNDGRLFKYLRGQKQEFEIEPIDPEIERATKVAISSNLKYIYILEPINQRLVVFDKTGKFLLQYQFSQLKNIKDFIVDEEKKLIYLLNEASVFKIDGEHFK